MKSELLKMQWKQVDRQAGQLRLSNRARPRNKEGRTFPYARVPALKQAIDGQWAEHERLTQQGELVPSVFHRDGAPILSMLKAFKAACRAAGVPSGFLTPAPHRRPQPR